MGNESSRDHSKKSVLVVDDEPGIREFLKFALESNGYDVITTSTGAAALTALREHAPDCVLVDLSFDDTSLTELCRVIKEGTKKKDTRIIVMSGLPLPDIMERASDIKANDYLAKPFDLCSVLEKVAALV